ncbi:hypothetical protein TNCV_395041 [Trichonephila clavipes]|nr:hypothetical protein TNCV_395041 [Trichonephila clavipes]
MRKVGTRVLGGETRLWIWIAEAPLILMYITGRRYKWLCIRVPCFYFYSPITTKLAAVALRKYDQQKIALAIATLVIAAILLNDGPNAHSTFCTFTIGHSMKNWRQCET